MGKRPELPSQMTDVKRTLWYRGMRPMDVGTIINSVLREPWAGPGFKPNADVHLCVGLDVAKRLGEIIGGNRKV